MTPADAEKLLGGYAAGILTREERGALFAAAMENQALFDALADEESLRELLADPVARAELMSALEWKLPVVVDPPVWQQHAAPAARAAGRPMERASLPASVAPRPPEPAAPRRESWFSWLFRPAPLALAGSMAVAVVGVFVIRDQGREAAAPPPVQIAQQNNPAPLADSAKERDAVRPATKPAEPQASKVASKSEEARGGESAPARASAPPPVIAGPQPEPAPAATPAAAAPPLPIPAAPAEAAPQPPERVQVAEERKKAAPLGIGQSRPGAIGALAGRARGPAQQTVAALSATLEKRTSDGSYTAEPGPFSSTDSVRVAVLPSADGTLVVRFRGEPSLFSGPVRAGQRVNVALTGTGERTLEVRLLAQAPPASRRNTADQEQYSQSPSPGARRQEAASGVSPAASTVELPVVIR